MLSPIITIELVARRHTDLIAMNVFDFILALVSALHWSTLLFLDMFSQQQLTLPAVGIVLGSIDPGPLWEEGSVNVSCIPSWNTTSVLMASSRSHVHIRFSDANQTQVNDTQASSRSLTVKIAAGAHLHVRGSGLTRPPAPIEPPLRPISIVMTVLATLGALCNLCSLVLGFISRRPPPRIGPLDIMLPSGVDVQPLPFHALPDGLRQTFEGVLSIGSPETPCATGSATEGDNERSKGLLATPTVPGSYSTGAQYKGRQLAHIITPGAHPDVARSPCTPNPAIKMPGGYISGRSTVRPVIADDRSTWLAQFPTPTPPGAYPGLPPSPTPKRSLRDSPMVKMLAVNDDHPLEPVQRAAATSWPSPAHAHAEMDPVHQANSPVLSPPGPRKRVNLTPKASSASAPARPKRTPLGDVSNTLPLKSVAPSVAVAGKDSKRAKPLLAERSDTPCPTARSTTSQPGRPRVMPVNSLAPVRSLPLPQASISKKNPLPTPPPSRPSSLIAAREPESKLPSTLELVPCSGPATRVDSPRCLSSPPPDVSIASPAPTASSTPIGSPLRGPASRPLSFSSPSLVFPAGDYPAISEECFPAPYLDLSEVSAMPSPSPRASPGCIPSSAPVASPAHFSEDIDGPNPSPAEKENSLDSEQERGEQAERSPDDLLGYLQEYQKVRSNPLGFRTLVLPVRMRPKSSEVAAMYDEAIELGNTYWDKMKRLRDEEILLTGKQDVERPPEAPVKSGPRPLLLPNLVQQSSHGAAHSTTKLVELAREAARTRAAYQDKLKEIRAVDHWARTQISKYELLARSSFGGVSPTLPLPQGLSVAEDEMVAMARFLPRNDSISGPSERLTPAALASRQSQEANPVRNFDKRVVVTHYGEVIGGQCEAEGISGMTVRGWPAIVTYIMWGSCAVWRRSRALGFPTSAGGGLESLVLRFVSGGLRLGRFSRSVSLLSHIVAVAGAWVLVLLRFFFILSFFVLFL
ncbi:hypothetical protein DL93DRAFT_2099971 [Clavulina sp. PMI_390]|nr:hypothetical protein DL93DRAFT_2099971 [Clavulina sp. PMI_390]